MYRNPRQLDSIAGDCQLAGAVMLGLSKREALMILVVILAGSALATWATMSVIGYVTAGNPDDPLTKAGGLSSEQKRALDSR